MPFRSFWMSQALKDLVYFNSSQIFLLATSLPQLRLYVSGVLFFSVVFLVTCSPSLQLAFGWENSHGCMPLTWHRVRKRNRWPPYPPTVTFQSCLFPKVLDPFTSDKSPHHQSIFWPHNFFIDDLSSCPLFFSVPLPCRWVFLLTSWHFSVLIILSIEIPIGNTIIPYES